MTKILVFKMSSSDSNSRSRFNSFNTESEPLTKSDNEESIKVHQRVKVTNKPPIYIKSLEESPCSWCNLNGHRLVNCKLKQIKVVSSMRNDDYHSKIASYSLKEEIEKLTQLEKESKGKRKEKATYIISESSYPSSRIVREYGNKNWVILFGTSRHMCSEIDNFVNFTKLKRMYLEMEDRKLLEVKGIGDIYIDMIGEKKNIFSRKKKLLLENVLYVPDFLRFSNSFSLYQIVRDFEGSCKIGKTISLFRNDKKTIIYNKCNEKIFQAILEKGFYVMNFTSSWNYYTRYD